jgi:LPS-assembly protein
MKPLSRLVLIAITAFSSVTTLSVLAQQSTPPSQTELDDAIREGNKARGTIPTPSSLVPRKAAGSRILEADRIEGQTGVRASAEGRVELRQDTLRILTDRLDYDDVTDTATAPGTIRMLRGNDIITGNGLNYLVETEKGTLGSPTYFFGRDPSRPTQRYDARGSADKMNFEGPDRERLFNANYTTCKVNEEDWYLRVSELALDRSTNVGTGINGRIEFKGVPILYVPYMTFPLNSDRRSGFLPPSFGTSTAGGVEIAVPYYWNIAPNMDATITPKIFTRRGLQIGNEFRYLNRHSIGEADVEFLPNDRVLDRNRYLFSWRHFQNLDGALGLFGRGWTATVNAQKVSDDGYFRDLSTRIASTAQTNLPRDTLLNYASDVGNMSVRLLSFQTLQDPLAPIVTPYRLAPQITFNARPARISGVEFNTLGEFTDFTHPTLVNGKRFLIYPSASLAVIRPFGFFKPKLGFHFTRYDLTKNETGFSGGTRSLPIFSIDSGLAYERPLTLFGQSVTQTLEPRLFFLDVPFRNQSKLPLFSTSETDFNFAQIFNENAFVGGDRIADAKQLTAAVTTRFIENVTGIERLRAAIGQRYYFRTPQVTVSDTALGINPGGTSTRSDFLGAVSGQVSDHWSLDSTFQYSASNNRFQQSNLAARYADDRGRLVNFSYRFTRDSLKQVDISTQWPFGKAAPGWTLLARVNHSLKDRRLLEGLFGLEYNQGCWEFRLVAHRFTTATNQYSNSIQLQLELKGLSKLGINPIDTIRQNIAGYRRSEDR